MTMMDDMEDEELLIFCLKIWNIPELVSSVINAWSNINWWILVQCIFAHWHCKLLFCNSFMAFKANSISKPSLSCNHIRKQSLKDLGRKHSICFYFWILLPVGCRCVKQERRKEVDKTHKTISWTYNTSLPALKLLKEGLLNKSKSWKATFGVRSIREFFLLISIMSHDTWYMHAYIRTYSRVE